MQVNIQPTGKTNDLLKRLENSPNLLREAKIKALTLASMIFSNYSKEKAPVDTGNLRRNIKYKVDNNGNQSEIKADTDYALFQEMGTGIYGGKTRMITPKRAKYLVWKDKSGKTIFAKSVKGVKGKKYMEQGSEELKRRNKDINDKLYNELKKGLYD
jgi:HK97 gp10 family phage protein